MYEVNNKEIVNRKIFLCCFFGGWFGLHKFMQRKYAMGILYMCTLGLFFVGWLTDIAKLAKQVQHQRYLNEQHFERMERKAAQKKENDRKRAITNQKIAQLPKFQIRINPECAKLTRKHISDFPDVRISSVGSKFNTSRISSFVVVDTETTGLSASTDRICQLSAILFVDGEPVKAFDTYVNPKKKMPQEATQVNGITDDMLIDAPTIDEVAPSFLEFIGDRPIVGYNIMFDLKFLYCSGIDVFQKRKFYDAYQLTRKVYQGLVNYQLSTVSEYIGIFCDAHNSLSDCWATGHVFLRTVERIVGNF